jgi:hypothetical protein
MGALGTRLSLRPLLSECGTIFLKTSGDQRRGNAKACREDERATLSAVIARLDRATQYSEASVIEPRSRGLLDTPHARGMTVLGRRSDSGFDIIASEAKQSISRFDATKIGLLRR